MIVTWTTEPTGPADGQTVIAEFGSAESVEVAHPAEDDVLADAEVAGDGGAIGCVFTVAEADAAETAAGAFDAQAVSTAAANRAVTRMANDRRVHITVSSAGAKLALPSETQPEPFSWSQLESWGHLPLPAAAGCSVRADCEVKITPGRRRADVVWSVIVT